MVGDDSDLTACEQSGANNGSDIVERAMVVALPRLVNSLAASAGMYQVRVETFQQSTCGSCAAKQSCGQGVLGRWFAAKQHHFDVSCDAKTAKTLAIGQWVEIAVVPAAVVIASLYAYLLPIMAMLVGAGLADAWFDNEALTILGGAVSMGAAFLTIKRYLLAQRFTSRYQPSVVRVLPAATVGFESATSSH